MGEPGPVQADQHAPPVGAGDRRDRGGQGGDVVGGVVAGGVAGPRVDHQDVVDVVAGGQVRDVADAALVRRFGVLLLVAGGQYDGGVQVDHRGPGQLPAGDPQPGEPSGSGCQDAPPQPPEPAHRLVDPGHLQGVGLVQGPPHRRRRGHRTDQLPQMRQRLEVPDRLPAGQLDQAQIDQDLTPVIVRVVPRSAHRRGDRRGQPGPFGQQPHRQQPSQRHAPLVVADQFQSPGPPRTLHQRGAPTSARRRSSQIASCLVRCTSLRICVRYAPACRPITSIPVKDLHAPVQGARGWLKLGACLPLTSPPSGTVESV